MCLPKLVCIVGTTASGKSDLAVALALQFGGEVVSADSMQIYRGFDIGTAKITAAEMRGVAHHMLDVVPPDGAYSVADYCRDAGGGRRRHTVQGPSAGRRGRHRPRRGQPGREYAVCRRQGRIRPTAPRCSSMRGIRRGRAARKSSGRTTRSMRKKRMQTT